MSDSLKILNHFVKNLDKTLKILLNQKNVTLKPAVDLKKCVDKCSCSIDKSKIVDFARSNQNLLKTDNANKQIENIQLVLFSLKKYLDYLISSKSNLNYVQNIPNEIAKKSNELLKDTNIKSLEKSLKNLTKLNLNQFQNEQINDQIKNEIDYQPIGRSIDVTRVIERSDNDHQKEQTIKLKKNNFKLKEQKLSDRSKATRVPSSRLGRIVSYGELAAGLGLGTFIELSKRQFGLSDLTNSSSAFFNEANANRIVKTLCKVRGAALKIGQILSIQDLISPELQRIFERVRQSADYMPEYQLKKVLNDQLGTEWMSNFKEFDLKPFAAASIGQVHRAILNDGREVAIKIQYPGVADGIDSDIKNLVSVLKIWNILPPGLFIDSIIKVTKKELHWELDYEREIAMCKQYNQLVKQHLNDQNFRVPNVVDNLCTKKVITSEMVYGIPVDKLDPNEFDQQTINDVARRLLQLLLHEIFIFKFMQTDPNWANFFFDPNSNQISLIDFGAARDYPDEFVYKYYKILKAASQKNRDEILKHSIKIGFLTGHESRQMIDAHIDSVLILGEVFEYNDEYDFGGQDISRRIHKTVPIMIENRLTPPPDEIYSLHRKLSGVFMLLVKLKAKVNCRSLFNEVSEMYEQNEGLTK